MNSSSKSITHQTPTQSKLPLTVVIMTHRWDRRCLQAIKSAQPAAEILIIDHQSGAPWKTIKQTHQLRSTIINYNQPIEDFARVRQLALSRAQYDWVFFLDSDEQIESQSWPEIAALVAPPAAHTHSYAAARVRRVDYFYGRQLKWGEVRQTTIVRLVKKPHTLFHRPVHEVAQIDGPIYGSAITLKHQAHTSINEFLNDVARYARLEASYRRQQHPPSRFQHICQLLIYPPAKWLLNVVLKQGWRDGWRGIVYATIMSLHSFWVRVELYEQTHS